MMLVEKSPSAAPERAEEQDTLKKMIVASC
jgi:hypothetical protein